MTSGGGRAGGAEPYRVMLVEDATVIRSMLTRALEQDPQIEVAASVINGEMAVSTLKRNPGIEVVLLDIDMPVMDGLTALPLLLAAKPEVKIIMNDEEVVGGKGQLINECFDHRTRCVHPGQWRGQGHLMRSNPAMASTRRPDYLQRDRPACRRFLQCTSTDVVSSTPVVATRIAKSHDEAQSECLFS